MADQGAPAQPTADGPARARVAALLERLTRINLQVVVVSPPDATRIAARDHARTAATIAGRAHLLDESTAAARETALRAFAQSGFSGTWAATETSASVANARDRAAAAAAFEEAATAAVVEDLVDDETLGVLRSTTNELADLTGVPSPGALSSFTSPPARGSRSAIQVTLVSLYVVAVIVGLGAGLPPGGVALLAILIAVVVGVAWRRRRPESIN
jgi:hypothetical protein